MVDQLETIGEWIREDLSARNEARDGALRRSRELIRLCAKAIRAAHREDWEKAGQMLGQAELVAADVMAALQPYPDLFYAGYTQDGLKELAEAHLTLALMTSGVLPEPEALDIPSAAYLGGLCEAASELRRRCLDLLRRGKTEETEHLLAAMDSVYELLVTFDFPDAITGGLRRRTDQLRGVLERTRSDITRALRQDRLMEALDRFERQVDG